MKIGVSIAILYLLFATSLYTCKKSAGEQTDGLITVADDTQTLQNQIYAGNVTLVAGKTYHVSGLDVTHSINMNGATINMTNTLTGVYALTVSAPNVQITNGSISGNWDNTTPGDSNGYSGINIMADSCSIAHVNISGFPAYGIYEGAFNKTSITNCNISNTGYIGFFFYAETASTNGGVFSNNVVDRSMLPPASIQQMGIGIRGSLYNPNNITSGWTVANNTIKLPVNPLDISAEGMEIRKCNNTIIQNNTITSGSIGISVVNCNGNTVQGNSCSTASLEGIEFADCTKCKGMNNVISGSGQVGELLDGDTGCNNIEITGDKISGTAQECVHVYYQTQNVTITGCTLTVSTPDTYAINLQRANYVNVVNTSINGNGIGTAAIQLDNCPGNFTLTGGTIAGFKLSVVYIYNSTSGLVTNNVSVSGAMIGNVPQGLAFELDNGGLLGSNISISL